MTPNELDRLIAMLAPSAEEVTVDFVRRTLAGAIECVPFVPVVDAEINEESRLTTERSDQQSVDAFDTWLPNDPRNW